MKFQDNFRVPDDDNLYGIIYTIDSPLEIANHFDKQGWSIRKSSWTDYEVKAEWAELEIVRNHEAALISGAIDGQKFDDLKVTLMTFEYQFSIELYDQENKLIKAATNKVQPSS
ncbi:hypothetical protein [Catalinimonas alkaloidigena]|uniref:hypothetical protein n=1 Tax=Catalinimonas alkaloidigena TaxID=1075417 RepID=UPI000B7EB1BB|nr:hypothetical protein [Catalinimonas alkaloidigena]